MVSKRKILLSDFLTDVLLISGLRIFVKILDCTYSTKTSWETNQSGLSGFSAEMRLGAQALVPPQTDRPRARARPAHSFQGPRGSVGAGWQLWPMPYTIH